MNIAIWDGAATVEMLMPYFHLPKGPYLLAANKQRVRSYETKACLARRTFRLLSNDKSYPVRSHYSPVNASTVKVHQAP